MGSWSSTETCLLPPSSSFFKHRWLTRPCRRTDCSHLRLGPDLQLRLLASQSCWTHRPYRMPHRVPHPERLLSCPVVSCCPRLYLAYRTRATIPLDRPKLKPEARN